MTKIILSLFLVLIALTSIATVCASDSDNCTVESCFMNPIQCVDNNSQVSNSQQVLVSEDNNTFQDTNDTENNVENETVIDNSNFLPKDGRFPILFDPATNIIQLNPNDNHLESIGWTIYTPCGKLYIHGAKEFDLISTIKGLNIAPGHYNCSIVVCESQWIGSNYDRYFEFRDTEFRDTIEFTIDVEFRDTIEFTIDVDENNNIQLGHVEKSKHERIYPERYIVNDVYPQ